MARACYVLASQTNPNKGYVGFTVNPARRLRQHNGDLKAGARRTKKGRPWTMALLVVGFASTTQALQFEWQVQHPAKSRLYSKTLPKKRVEGFTRNVAALLATEKYRTAPLKVMIMDDVAASAFFKVGDHEGSAAGTGGTASLASYRDRAYFVP